MAIALNSLDPALRKRVEAAIKKEDMNKATFKAMSGVAAMHRKVANDAAESYLASKDAPMVARGLSVKRTKGKGKMSRHKQGEMNKTEAKFLAEHLTGKYPVILFESLKFRLADNTNYTPDFVTVSDDGTLTAWECKGGYFFDDARVKWKVAAEQYFWLDWKWCTYKNKQWKIENYR